MAFRDYSTTPRLNTTIGDGIFIGPNMARDDVREALQTLAADGRDLYDLLNTTLIGGASPYIWADSAAGSDTSSGLSRARAKQSLSAASALYSSATPILALVAGSAWREDLPIDGDYEVVVDGVGPMLTIDGSDIVTGWTLHATQPNVYQVSFTHEGATNTTARLRVFEDDEILTRVADVATCNSTAGSFVDATVGATGSGDTRTQTIYIRPTVAGNPDTNGLRIEITKREYVIVAPSETDIAVRGPLEVRRAIGNNGGVNMNGDGHVTQVLTADGSKHGMLVGANAVSDCIAWRLDKPVAAEGSNTLFVFYQNDPTGKSVVASRCGAVQPDAAGTALSGHVCFLAHASAPGLYYDTMTIRQCWGDGPVFGGHPTGGTVQLEEGCHWRALALVQAIGDYEVRYTTGTVPESIGGTTSEASQLSEQTFTDCAYWFGLRTSTSPSCFQLVGRTSDSDLAVVLDHSAFVMEHGTAFGAAMFGTGAANGGSLTASYSLIVGENGSAIDLPTGVSYVGDFNVFWTTNQFSAATDTLFNHHGVAKATLTLWQAATSQDANSCYLKTADQTAGGANAFFLGWAEAAPATDLSTVGPAVGDFRVNPAAKVYNAAGTGFTGTFPNGTTPITAAGPRKHWDWNRGEPVAGAPEVWPTVPTSLTAARSYVRNPAAWDWAA